MDRAFYMDIEDHYVHYLARAVSHRLADHHQHYAAAVSLHSLRVYASRFMGALRPVSVGQIVGLPCVEGSSIRRA